MYTRNRNYQQGYSLSLVGTLPPNRQPQPELKVRQPQSFAPVEVPVVRYELLEPSQSLAMPPAMPSSFLSSLHFSFDAQIGAQGGLGPKEGNSPRHTHQL